MISRNEADEYVSGRLSNFQRPTEALGRVFTADQQEHLEQARHSIDSTARRIAFCTYENPFAKSGGLAAVADRLPPALKHHAKNVVLLSPLHSRLSTRPSAEKLKSLGTTDVPFDGKDFPLELWEHIDGKKNRWILMRSKGFFEADGGATKSDPYVHEDQRQLLADGLFACAAVPRALALLGWKDNVIIHAQDWQFVSTALTVKCAMLEKVVNSAAVVLTMHNPYDSTLSHESVRRMIPSRTIGSEACEMLGRGTVYQSMIPFLDAPVCTVSRTFAEELISDPLQTKHFAPHLQPVLHAQGVIGIDNGLFGDSRCKFSDAAVVEALAGNPSLILAEKRSNRSAALAVIDEYQDKRILGRLKGNDGGPLSELPDDVPIFMMFGRMDPGQKGFDVLARAIEALPRMQCRFILTPAVSGDVGEYVNDLEELAESRDGEVIVYPFRMERGYMELMAGASFCVMPSLYEPFGGASEPYLAGTPVVARATGGLVQQVVDVDADPARATGVVYRESPPAGTNVGQDWQTLENELHPRQRMAVPTYSAMVESLAKALGRADEMFRDDTTSYAKIMANLFPQAMRFSWQTAAREYAAVYDAAAW